MANLQKLKHIELPQHEEWHFATCPNGQRHCCLAYEYARHLPWLVKKIQEAWANGPKEGPNDFQLDEHGNMRCRLHRWGTDKDGVVRYDGPDGPQEWYELRVPHDFPATPFLMLPKRTDFIWPEPESYFETMEPPLLPTDRFMPTEPPDPYNDTSHLTTEAFQINWFHSDTKIAASFKHWLSELKRTGKRPIEKHIDPLKEPKPSRFYTELRALGAYRLLRGGYFRTAEIAEEEMKAGRHKPTVALKPTWPPYTDASEWTRAAGAAEKELKRFGLASREEDAWLKEASRKTT